MAEKINREVAFMKIVITSDVYAKLDNFKKGWKDEKPVDVLIRVETGNGQAHEQEFSMSEFLEALGFEDADAEIKPCATCGGSGEVSSMENVYPGEPHQANVGTSNCPDCTPEPSNDGGDE